MGRLDDLVGAGCSVSPLTFPFVLRPSDGDGDVACVWDRTGCGLDGSLRGGEVGNGGASSSGDGIVCMFFELVPRRSPPRRGLDFFSGDGGRSPADLLSFRLPMTVPSRRNPKPLRFCSGAGDAATISMPTTRLPRSLTWKHASRPRS